MQKSFLVLLFLSISFLSPGQEDHEIFINIGENEGLSQRWVMAIHQDRYGFMWFGTKDGLNRYDGYEFKYYRHHNEEEGLPSSTINFILEDLAGQLWVCTDRGVCIYDRDIDKFDLFPHVKEEIVEHMLQTDSVTYWFGTKNGLYLYNSKKDVVISHYTESEDEGLCSNLITCLVEDKNKNLWVGTQSGLCLFRKNDSSFVELNPGHYTNTHIFDLTKDQEGRIWITDYDRGLDVYIPEEETYSNTGFFHTVDGKGRALRVDRNNRLWVSWGQKQGAQAFDLNHFNETQKVFYPEAFNEKVLIENSIDNINLDNEGNLWFGTYDRGIFFNTSAAKKFYRITEKDKDKLPLSSYIVNVFYEDGNYLWIGTEFGLNRYDRNNGKVSQYVYDVNDIHSLGANAIYEIYKDSQGHLWVGTWNGGLNLYNPKTDNFTRIKPDPVKEKKILTENVFSILEVRPGILWLGVIYGGGLIEYNTRSGKFTDLSSNLLIPNISTNKSVNDLLKASDGKIWISAYQSLFVYDPEQNTYTSFSYIPHKKDGLTLGETSVLFEDSRKNIWIGTEGGLNCFIPEKNSFKQYTTEDGLPSNFVNGILEDNDANLWISTNQGLIKFKDGISIPDSALFITYSKSDGLASREFIKRSCIKDSKDKLYFGGINGFTFFRPEEITRNLVPPEVRFVDLYIWNERIVPGTEGAVLNKALYLVDEIELNHDQNMISVQYAALNYLNPEKNSFAHRLEGYDEKWVQTNNEHFTTYTNLDPGDYILHIRASNNDGVWNNVGTSLKIRINPPWWETLIARIIFILLIIIFLFLLYKWQVRTLTIKKEILEKKVKERTKELTDLNSVLEEVKEEVTMQNEELLEHRQNLQKLVEERTEKLKKALEKAEEADRLKSSFLANMSHEIRTPMNSIVGFASLLDDEDLDHKTRSHYIKLINSNSDTLLVLINDILEISIIEADQIVIENQNFIIDGIMSDLEDTFRLRNPQKLNIEFVNRHQRKNASVYGDPIRLNQCLTNLIHNAVKFTEHGYVKFGYTLKDGEITCFVSDTGIGIKESKKDDIFNYFYKIEDDQTKLYRGTGLGLAITQKLVYLMGGNISFESEPGVGSTFYITLPLIKGEADLPEEKAASKPNIQNFDDLLILVAEDEPANSMLMQETLKKTGAKVECVSTGLEAVKFAKSHAKEANLLILMDIKMPVMDGTTALHKIRKAGINAPAIAITAFARQKDRKSLLEAGFTDYIAKPVRPNELLNIIKLNILDLK